MEWIRIYELELSSKQITRAHSLMQWAINLPKGAARRHNLPMAAIVDEFQVLTRVYNPDNQQFRNLTDSFQHASETRYAPMLVSGSSVSMMVGDALGGLLSGRFQTWRLQPLSQEYAIDLALRLGKHIGIPVSEEVALALFELTKGYPYSIERILYRLSPDIQRLPDLEALPAIIFFGNYSATPSQPPPYTGEEPTSPICIKRRQIAWKSTGRQPNLPGRLGCSIP